MEWLKEGPPCQGKAKAGGFEALPQSDEEKSRATSQETVAGAICSVPWGEPRKESAAAFSLPLPLNILLANLQVQSNGRFTACSAPFYGSRLID